MQTEMVFRTHGGARLGAGRKRRLASDPLHGVREVHRGWKPVHVVCRCEKTVGRLRTGLVRDAIGDAIARVNARGAVRVVHVSVQHDHVHFLVEADTHDLFVSGMRALTITVAKAINGAQKRHGRVFTYRYHATSIDSPRQARNVLAYVLNNWRHHLEDETSIPSRCAPIDPYASGGGFTGWRERVRVGYATLSTAPPSTWLLRTGWTQHPLISIHETPALRSDPK